MSICFVENVFNQQILSKMGHLKKKKTTSTFLSSTKNPLNMELQRNRTLKTLTFLLHLSHVPYNLHTGHMDERIEFYHCPPNFVILNIQTQYLYILLFQQKPCTWNCSRPKPATILNSTTLNKRKHQHFATCTINYLYIPAIFTPITWTEFTCNHDEEEAQLHVSIF